MLVIIAWIYLGCILVALAIAGLMRITTGGEIGPFRMLALCASAPVFVLALVLCLVGDWLRISGEYINVAGNFIGYGLTDRLPE
jgi:hypothetical protein